MQKIEIAIAIVKQADCFLLQRRVNDPRKGMAGMVAGFGGQIEIGETPAEACARELREESGISVSTESLQSLGTFQALSIRNNVEVSIAAHGFYVVVPDDTEPDIQEGSLITLKADEIAGTTDITDVTRYFLDAALVL